VDHKDPKELAKQADELWALHNTNGGGIAAVQQDCVEGDFVAGVRAGDRQRLQRARPRMRRPRRWTPCFVS
jgi:hypothetical protein